MNFELNGNCNFEQHFSNVKDGHICKTNCGFDFMQLRYVVNGECFVKGKNLTLKSGDMLFISNNMPYELIWSGEKIEFYTLEFNTNYFDFLEKDIYKIKDFDFYDCFITIGKTKDKLKALSSFYLLLSKTENYLKNQSFNTQNFLAPAKEYIINHCTENIQIKTLASLCFLSESRFYYLFKKDTGKTPVEYKNELKIKKALYMIDDGFSIEEICDSLNFCSPAFFRRIFKNNMGITPSQYKKRKAINK